MARVKHIREDAGALVCPECVYKRYAVCNHPKFKHFKVKPLIIALEGTVHPLFCPLKEKT